MKQACQVTAPYFGYRPQPCVNMALHLPLGGPVFTGNTDALQCRGLGDHHGMRSYSEVTTFMSFQRHIWRPQGHTEGMSHNQTCHWHSSHHWHNISS